jgi:hypothetical protein
VLGLLLPSRCLSLSKQLHYSPPFEEHSTDHSPSRVKYRVEFEDTDYDIPALNLNVPNDTVLVHGREILTYLVNNHDDKRKISYETGSLMAYKVRTRYREVINDIKNLGEDGGSFCALIYGLVWSREQWTVGRKVYVFPF